MKRLGCYGWQIDGVDFSRVIVFRGSPVSGPRSLRRSAGVDGGRDAPVVTCGGRAQVSRIHDQDPCRVSRRALSPDTRLLGPAAECPSAAASCRAPVSKSFCHQQIESAESPQDFQRVVSTSMTPRHISAGQRPITNEGHPPPPAHDQSTNYR